MERLFRIKMELVLVKEGGFLLADLRDLPSEDVIDYFNFLQRGKEIQAEQEERWYQETKTRR